MIEKEQLEAIIGQHRLENPQENPKEDKPKEKEDGKIPDSKDG